MKQRHGLKSLAEANNPTAQKMKTPLRISLVNVTKFTVSFGFGHIY